MREIKFRGRRLDNTEWIYGDLLQAKTPSGRRQAWIFHDIYGNTPVDPATVGQFTSLYDKTSAEIYEGDILETENGLQVVRFGKHELACCGCRYDAHQSVGFFMTWGRQIPSADEEEWNDYKLHIIGNIHENTEQSKGGDNA